MHVLQCMNIALLPLFDLTIVQGIDKVATEVAITNIGRHFDPVIAYLQWGKGELGYPGQVTPQDTAQSHHRPQRSLHPYQHLVFDVSSEAARSSLSYRTVNALGSGHYRRSTPTDPAPSASSTGLSEIRVAAKLSSLDHQPLSPPIATPAHIQRDSAD